MCLTHEALPGIPHANILAYWQCGTYICILGSTIHLITLHDDRIGFICAQFSVLNRLLEHPFSDTPPSIPEPRAGPHARLFSLTRHVIEKTMYIYL